MKWKMAKTYPNAIVCLYILSLSLKEQALPESWVCLELEKKNLRNACHL
jgi:hypothetical protein